MGKQQQPPAAVPDRPPEPPTAARNRLTFRCAFVILFALAASLVGILSLPSFLPHRSRHRTPSAAIEASFILQKPVSFLRPYTKRLEYDIYEEIGVPSTKVTVISMLPLLFENSTSVVFGVLPDEKYVTIDPVAKSLLRSSLVELAIRQSNLSLTDSIFGHPSSFNVLKFPGGISVIPTQSASLWQITRFLFSFTLNNSIADVLKNLDDLKGQLKVGLSLKSNENVFVQLINLDGSTATPPVTVQTSILSDIGSRILLPPRLKQLAQVISGSEQNLGLNHTLFGNVKGITLSSYLNNSITLPEPPSPSPSPSYTQLAPPPNVSPTLSPVHANRPCCRCVRVAPSRSPPSLAPSHSYRLKPPCPQPSRSSPPTVSPLLLSPEHSPSPSSPRKVFPPASAGVSPAPSVYLQNPSRRGKNDDSAAASLPASLFSSSSTSNSAINAWTVILVLLFQFPLMNVQ